MADFFVNFIWYLLAFAAGALVAWLIAGGVYPARSEEGALSALADVVDKEAAR